MIGKYTLLISYNNSTVYNSLQAFTNGLQHGLHQFTAAAAKHEVLRFCPGALDLFGAQVRQTLVH